MSSPVASHKRLLTRSALLLHFAISAFLFTTSRLPSFDSSASLVLNQPWLIPLLRWDVFHYAHVAQTDYAYEHEYAFFPGTPTIMKYGAKVLRFVGMPTTDKLAGELIAGMLASTALAVPAINALYDLTMHHFASPNMALLVSLLSLLSSSPATLRFAPCAEPFFTYLSYKGMLYSARRQFVFASITFTLASLFRSNGMMLAGFVIWEIMIEPVLRSASPVRDIISAQMIHRIFTCFLLSVPPLLPFLWHQYNGYDAFCTIPIGERRPWCMNRLPFIYSFVQSEYWDVGLFRYWTLQQAPNILLAAPVLVLLVYGSMTHIRRAFLPRVISVMGRIRHPTSASSQTRDRDADGLAVASSQSGPFGNPSLTPYAIHTCVISIILLVSAHTQIALRLVSALPFTYWAAAQLFFPAPSTRNKAAPVDDRWQHGEDDCDKNQIYKPSRSTRWWVGWSMAWGSISLVTWGAFLPPA